MIVLFTGAEPQEIDGWSLLDASSGDVGAGWSARGSPLPHVDADTRREDQRPKVGAAVNRSILDRVHQDDQVWGNRQAAEDVGCLPSLARQMSVSTGSPHRPRPASIPFWESHSPWVNDVE